MLETEIVKLRKAVEALTTALEKNPLDMAPDEVPKNQVEPTPSEVPKNQVEAATGDEVTPAMVKDVTLKASRAGHKDAIRAKLKAMSTGKITDLSADQQVTFYNWINTLGEK